MFKNLRFVGCYIFLYTMTSDVDMVLWSIYKTYLSCVFAARLLAHEWSHRFRARWSEWESNSRPKLVLCGAPFPPFHATLRETQQSIDRPIAWSIHFPEGEPAACESECESKSEAKSGGGRRGRVGIDARWLGGCDRASGEQPANRGAGWTAEKVAQDFAAESDSGTLHTKWTRRLYEAVLCVCVPVWCVYMSMCVCVCLMCVAIHTRMYPNSKETKGRQHTNMMGSIGHVISSLSNKCDSFT